MVLARGVNDALRGINLGNNSIAENETSRTAVGNFSAVDSHTGKVFMCSREQGYFCCVRFFGSQEKNLLTFGLYQSAVRYRSILVGSQNSVYSALWLNSSYPPVDGRH